MPTLPAGLVSTAWIALTPWAASVSSLSHVPLALTVKASMTVPLSRREIMSPDVAEPSMSCRGWFVRLPVPDRAMVGGVTV